MGSIFSKSASPAAKAAQAAKRQYPQTVATASSPSNVQEAPRPSNQAPPPSTTGPTVHPRTSHASSSRDDGNALLQYLSSSPLSRLIPLPLAINRDAQDPDFARSLRSLGPVQPNPTFSNTSTFNNASEAAGSQPKIFPDTSTNPALQILNARASLSAAAEREFEQTGRKGFAGREFLDVITIRQILSLRDEQNVPAATIEKQLGLKAGVVARLGKREVTRNAVMGGGSVE